jgi:hypothetical protein
VTAAKLDSLIVDQEEPIRTYQEDTCENSSLPSRWLHRLPFCGLPIIRV